MDTAEREGEREREKEREYEQLVIHKDGQEREQTTRWTMCHMNKKQNRQTDRHIPYLTRPDSYQ